MRLYLTLHLMDQSFIHQFVHSFIYLFHSFIHLFIHLLICSFTNDMVCEPREMARGYSTCHEGVKI